MAETYLCHGEEIHFNNGSVLLLQNLWIEIGNELHNQEGVQELIERIKTCNDFGQGNRAMDIVDSHEDFKTISPLLRWYEINEILLGELNKLKGKSRIFELEPSVEIVEDRKRKIQVFLNSIKIEINNKK